MHPTSVFSIAAATVVALAAGVPSTAPASASPAAPSTALVVASPAAPSLALVNDIALNATFACQTGHEWQQHLSSPATGDLFGNGRKEIIAAFPDGSVHAWYTDNFAEVTGSGWGWPMHTGDDVASSPTLAVLDGDTLPSVIVSSYAGTVNIWDRFGHERTGWPQRALYANPSAGIATGFFSSVAVGDVFGDGRQELFATALDQHTYGWFSSGYQVPGWPKLTYDSGLATPALADLQHNGTLSIVTPYDASGLYGVRGGLYSAWAADGHQLWVRGFDEVPWSSPAITDFGGGGYVIVNGTGHNYHQLRNPANGEYIVGMNEDGSNHAWYPIATPNDVSFSSPAVGDLYGNGGRQVVEVTEGGTLYGLDANGTALPGFPLNLPDGHNFAEGAVIAPVDGSGQNGIYAATGHGLAVYSMNNLGSPTVMYADIYHRTVAFGTPTVADLGGGHLSAVLATGTWPQSCNTTSTYHITVWSVAGTNPAAMGPASWPTFHGNMQRSGSNGPAPCTAGTLPVNDVVAVNGVRNGLMVRSPSGGPFCSLGGGFSGTAAVAAVPSATPGQPGSPLYIVTGGDHDLWVRGNATGWQRLSTQPVYCTDPGAVVVPGGGGSNTLVVGCRGGDGALWYAQGLVTPGSLPTLSGWGTLGGTLTSGPAIAVVGGQLSFYVSGAGDLHMWTRTLSAGWSYLPWRAIGHPAVASKGGVAYFACQGADRALWYSINNGSGWGSTGTAGGTLRDGTAVLAGSGGATLAVEGGDHTLWSVPVSSGGSVGTWQNLQGYSNTGAAGSGF